MTHFRLASLTGIIGPLWLGGTILVLSIAQYDFMRGLRWHPLIAPEIDWPSGLALGPYGGWMTFAFIFSGVCLFIFAQGMRRLLGDTRRSRFSFYLLCGASVGLLLLAFPTDPTFRNTPATWPGRIHDGAFALLGLCLLPSFLLMASQLRHQRHRPHWQAIANGAIIVALTLIPAFLLKGIFFYLFLIASLGWIVWVAIGLGSEDVMTHER